MSKAINANSFYFNFDTLQKSTEPKEGFTFIASTLELKVWRKLRAIEADFLYQYSLNLLEATESHSIHAWKVDFKLPGKVILEAKGEWIMKPSFKGERAHFLLNHQLAESLGFKVILVAEKEFNLSKTIKVHSLESLDNDLLQ